MVEESFCFCAVRGQIHKKVERVMPLIVSLMIDHSHRLLEASGWGAEQLGWGSSSPGYVVGVS